LRLQPLIDLTDLGAESIDMAIRWGNGRWTDLEIEPLLHCPAFPVAGAGIAQRVGETGLEAALPDLPLLQDRDGSDAWADWHTAAGLPYQPAGDGLVIPDPNVRVQAVIDGQGVALGAARSTALRTEHDHIARLPRLVCARGGRRRGITRPIE